MNYHLSEWIEKSNQDMLTYKICDGVRDSAGKGKQNLAGGRIGGDRG